MIPPWPQLCEMAQTVVDATRRSLPPPLLGPAQNLPVVCERTPSQPVLDEGFEPDLLGLFVGSPLADSEPSPMAPQILLYLENLWEAADQDEAIYRDEVRITYLHELGHYLGLDEADLEARGLL